MTNLADASSVPSRPSPFAGNMTCVLAMLFFALGFPAADFLLEGWGALSLIAVRNCIGVASVMLLWVALEGRSGFNAVPWARAALIGGVGFGAGSTLLLLSQSMTNAVTAALVATSMPLIAVGLEVILDGRRLSKWFILGLGLVLVGGAYAAGVGTGSAEFGPGILVGLTATLLYSWGSRQAVKGLPGMSAIAQTGATMIGMAVFCVLTAVIAGLMGTEMARVPAITLHDLGALAVYGLLGLTVSQILWIQSVRTIGVGIASFHINAVPFYVMIVVLATGGVWSNQQFVGALIVVLGVITSQVRQGQKVT